VEGAGRIGLILATGGLGDKSFNDVSCAGALKAKEELGVELNYVEPKAIAEYEGYQRDFASSGDYEIIVCVGFDQADALNKIAREIAGLEQGFLSVMLCAAANFSGRLSWGFVSDHLGRRKLLWLAFVIQAVIFFLFEQMTNLALLLIAKSGVGFTFGGMLAFFPAICADYFGLQNLGLNYGILFTAWGVGGVIGPLLGGLIRDLTGAHTLSFFLFGCASTLGIILVMLLKPRE